MATRIRLASLGVAAALALLLMATALAGVAYAKIIRGTPDNDYLLGAYAARIPREVVDCDRGRRSVEVRVTNVSLDRDTSVVRRELGPCKLWYHVNP
jgi:hypothetical protein